LKNNNSKGKLFLVPAPLGEDATHVIPEYVKQEVFQLKHFIVEREKTARRYLKTIGYPHSLDTLTLFALNEHTPQQDLAAYIKPLEEGISMGLISEAGCPGVADPGAPIVAMCHNLGIQVIPFVGPSSILLSLMASGMNEQNFAFVGYLPVKDPERKKEIQRLELLSQKSGQTQIFIETPYRNHQLLKDLIANCREHTKLCIAVDITLPSEQILTQPIKNWKHAKIEMNKKPAVFLLQG
jgi:16S rRNA (cytidine1402-2'-O)-methyltransferase